MPWLQKWADERGVAVLAVNTADTPARVRPFFEKEKLTLRALFQKKDEVTRAYGVRAEPTTYFIGADGRIVAAVIGADDEALQNALDRLLSGK